MVKVEAEKILLAARDLANYLACRHLTELDRAFAEGRRAGPAWRDPALALLQERGLAHEQAYVAHLRESGLEVVELRDVDGTTAAERTLDAMREGAGAIVQAVLQEGRWTGRADVLLRVPEASALGAWSYEVVDTKLAQETRGGTVLQLCLYSNLVGELQDRVPALMHVVKPGDGFPRESFRFADFKAYYRLVRRRLEETVGMPASGSTYPDPVPHCDICRWWRECDAKRHEDDHLCLVAGLRSLHITELKRQEIDTLEQLAEAAEPLRERPERGSKEVFARAHAQARIQLAGRRAGHPVHELLPATPGQGLLRLPEPDPGDLFFDIESDPFVEAGGLEYLLGLAHVGDGGAMEYQAFWALDRTEERRSFERFLDLVMESWRQHPGMHVYHFSPYEPAAVKRLMGRYGTREADIDRLLRAKRFVDLHAVTRQGIRASVEKYSLKELEPFCGYERGMELPVAAAALRHVGCALELGAPREVSAADRDTVEAYNRDDCFSTAALRRWLEERRSELEQREGTLPRPESGSGEASEAIEERAADVQEVYEQLVDGLPEDRSTWGPGEEARWLLAHQLDYFRREDRCAWWDFFRIHELDHEELLEERKAVSGLEFVGGAGGTAKCPIHRYRFPAQEAALDEGDELHEVGGEATGTVNAIDQARRTLEIKKRANAGAHHPFAVLVKERVSPQPVDGALLQLARSVAEHGADGEGPFRAARDLLLRRAPRLVEAQEGALRRPGEDIVTAAVQLARSLDHGVLAIQGPPGSGKTYTGARMIVQLARAGMRVGVTAVSHKVIQNFLDKTLEAAAEAGVFLEAVHKVSKRSVETRDGLNEETDNSRARQGLDSGKVLGGTTWLWARDDMVETVDYLFVDEAGQMSLAHALAAGRSAKNLVLIGDPQQLEQPQRGAHPEGAEVAALVHLLEGRKTIPEDRGLFLDVTWRLHPEICAFTSEIYYEDRLRSRAGLERQALAGDTLFAGSGLFFVPVPHEGNQSRAVEEVKAVARLLDDLLERGVQWIDNEGTSRTLLAKDVLVIAPYNAQVSALAGRLPQGVRVGTVDKFQGQEAPVAVYSMTSSSAADAPRGMSFLYNPNRLNVATSRARCACIVVASPRLFEPDCRTPEQMRLANGLCRFRELAREIAIQV